MLSIGVNANNRPIEPTIAPPDFGIQKNLNPVADFDFLRHVTLSTPIRPKHETKTKDDHDATINRPLRIASHVTTGQDVDPLQEKRPASQYKQNADDAQKCSHFPKPHLSRGTF